MSSDRSHGRTRYRAGCRCDICRSAQARYMRQYLRRRAAADAIRYEDRYAVAKTCPDCGKEFRTRHGSTWCKPCAGRRTIGVRNAQLIDAAEVRRQRRLPVPVFGPPRPMASVLHPRHPARWDWSKSSGLTYVYGPCRRCGQPFTAATGTIAAYCSDRCRKYEQRDRTRANTPGKVSDVVRWRIFERDRWRCHICGRVVRKRYRSSPSHPWGPTIDHLIPRSRGGSHVEANLATAHRMCNSIKSAGAANDQLRLAV